MNVTAVRLGFTPDEIGYALAFFSAPEIIAAMPDCDRTPYAAYSAAKAIESGNSLAYLPLVDGVPIGLFWGNWLSEKCIVGHWGVLDKHRTAGAPQRAVEAIAELIRKEFPSVTTLMGITPVTNRAALIGARVAGFKRVGILPQSHVANGVTCDSWILIKELYANDAEQ